MAKEKKESWLLSQDKVLSFLFYLLIIFLPTQLGRHFWPEFAFVFGLRLDYLSPTIYFTDLIIVLILVLSFKSLLLFLKNINKTSKVIIIVSIITLITGVVLSKSPFAGFYGLLKLTEYFFLFVFIMQRFQKLDKRNLFIAFSIPIIYEALLSFFQLINNGSIGGIMYFLGERTFTSSTPGIANASIGGELILRPYATFSHPNVLAGFLMVYSLFLFIAFSKKEKITLLFLILISTTSLVLTLSRTAIIYWIIVLVFLFATSIYKKYKNRKSNPLLFIFVVLAVLVSITILISNTFVTQRFLETRIYEQSVIQRQELITSSFQMFLKSPLLGVGVNNFYINLTNTTFVQPVHNIFLFIFSQGGIILFLIFLYLLTKTLIKVKKTKNIYLFLTLLSVMFLGSFDHYFLTLQQGQIITTLIFGAIYSYKTK